MVSSTTVGSISPSEGSSRTGSWNARSVVAIWPVGQAPESVVSTRTLWPGRISSWLPSTRSEGVSAPVGIPNGPLVVACWMEERRTLPSLVTV